MNTQAEIFARLMDKLDYFSHREIFVGLNKYECDKTLVIEFNDGSYLANRWHSDGSGLVSVIKVLEDFDPSLIDKIHEMYNLTEEVKPL